MTTQLKNNGQISQVDKSLRFSFLDGIFANAMVGFTQDYFAPFLLLLGGQVQQVGALTAIPNLVGALVQLKSADFTEKFKSRRKVINIFIFLHLLMLVPMAGIAFFAYKNPNFFILLVVLFTSLQAVAIPGWSSMMADLVRQDKRGDYFGWRNKNLGFIAVTLSFIAGFILHIMKNINIFYGFAIVFSFAFIFRTISWIFLTKMHEPVIEHSRKNAFSIIEFIRRSKKSNFAKFVFFAAAVNFSVFLASPFFAVFMLRDLSFSYILYTFIMITATVTSFMVMRRWGRYADKFGNLKILKLTAPLTAFIPLPWVICHSPWVLFLAQIWSGFVWAGFNLCATNFIYDCATPEKRTRCVAYYNFFVGLAICLGALSGGFLVKVLPALFGYKILAIFLVSAILRFSVGFFLSRNIKEVRVVNKIRSVELFFSMIGIKLFKIESCQ